MVDDVDLDSFMSTSKAEQRSSVEPSVQEMQRPKLKKIKRPKIRPQPDISPAPKKVIGDDDVSSFLKTDAAANETNLNIQEEKSQDSLSIGTELMTSIDAQNVAREEVLQNPYVFGGLPPELDFDEDNSGELDDASYVKKNIVYSVATACLVIGIVLGFLIAPKGTEQHGLEDVAWNMDTPKGRVRCGKTDPSQACTFYVLNSFRKELSGRDFYKLAAQMTGREEFMIETENMQYATTKIKPGFFAQLNIPALK